MFKAFLLQSNCVQHTSDDTDDDDDDDDKSLNLTGFIRYDPE